MESALRPPPRAALAHSVFELCSAEAPSALALLSRPQHQRHHQTACPHSQTSALATGAASAPRTVSPLQPPPRQPQPRQLQEQQQAQQLTQGQHGSGDAARLNAQLAGSPLAAPPTLRQSVLGAEAASAAGACVPGGALPVPAGLRQRLGGVVLRVGDMLQPSGEAPGDATWHERTANVLTSLPFLALGWRMHRWEGTHCAQLHGAACTQSARSRGWCLGPANSSASTRVTLNTRSRSKNSRTGPAFDPKSSDTSSNRPLVPRPCRRRLTPEGRHHARSMMAVGVAATLYHASSGAARRWARKLDYWAIAYTSSTMVGWPGACVRRLHSDHPTVAALDGCGSWGGHVRAYSGWWVHPSVCSVPAAPALPPPPQRLPLQIKCLFPDSGAARRAATASLAAVPFRPFAVSAAHALVMQGEFARQASRSKVRRRAEASCWLHCRFTGAGWPSAPRRAVALTALALAVLAFVHTLQLGHVLAWQAATLPQAGLCWPGRLTLLSSATPRRLSAPTSSGTTLLRRWAWAPFLRRTWCRTPALAGLCMQVGWSCAAALPRLPCVRASCTGAATPCPRALTAGRTPHCPAHSASIAASPHPAPCRASTAHHLPGLARLPARVACLCASLPTAERLVLSMLPQPGTAWPATAATPWTR